MDSYQGGQPQCYFDQQDSGYLLIQKKFKPNSENPPREVRVDYHVLLSHTFQVPVLYFAPMWMDTLEPLTLKELYSILVEKTSQESLEDVGVLGGVSHGVIRQFQGTVDSRIIRCWECPSITFTHAVQRIY